jgi:hypothetical protein
MHLRSGWVVIALSLLAPAPAPCQEPGDAGGPPPGEPADVALWRRGQQAGEAVVAGRAEAGRLQQRVKGERLAERLAEAAAAPGAPAGLGAARERLLAAWQRSWDVTTRPWPVDPTRVCWYAMLAFDSALRVPGQAGRAEAGPARTELQACVEKAGAALRILEESNRALAAAADEAARALAPAHGGG